MVDSTERVTQKQIYELQLSMMEKLELYHKETIIVNTRFESHVETVEAANKEVEKKFDAQKKSIEVVADNIAEFSDDFTIHKVNDNRFKSFAGIVMAIVVGVETYFASK